MKEEEKQLINKTKKAKSNLQRTSKMHNIIDKIEIKQEKGITLIALVITIVILIILATVTLNVVLGEGGLIDRAQQAKDLTEQAALEEQEGLNSLMSEFTNIMAEDQKPPTPTDPTEQTPTPIGNVTKGEAFDETTKVSDADGDILYVPKGFGIASDSPNEIDDGIVITNEGDTKQFVWIPVNDESLAKMYNTTGGEKQLLGVETKTSIYSNLRQRSGDSYKITTPGNNPSGIREPDVLSSYDTDPQYHNTILGYANIQAMADAMVEEYNTTYQSIAKYDGFYIGRFEITGNVDNPTVQKDGTVISKNWYNLKKACSNVVVEGEEYGAQSTMIYGNQWDEVCSWLKTKGYDTDSNSASWGNYSDSTGTAETNSGSKQTAGKNEAWQANNIYDLAGNCREWTQEANNTYFRVVRGGGYSESGSDNPVSGRNGYTPHISDYGSSRPALYVALNAE